MIQGTPPNPPDTDPARPETAAHVRDRPLRTAYAACEADPERHCDRIPHGVRDRATSGSMDRTPSHQEPP
jgi:hypothetical protein